MSSYQATLYQNGTLHEQYTYNVANSGEYRMLYRSWEAPLEFTSVNSSSIQLVSIDAPAGTSGMQRTIREMYSSRVRVIRSLKSQVGSLANTDEIGIFDPSYFAAGTYTVGYTYVVHPPVEYDALNDHLNLMLAGESHIPYHSVEITVPADNVVQIYAYPPMLDTEKTGDTYVITGSAAANENVAVEILTTSGGLGQVPGIRDEVPGLAGSTAWGNFWYNLPYWVAWFLNDLGKVAVLLVPFLFIVIYNRYGREKKFTVPAYLSTVPNPALKPWQVNLLFKDAALEFDQDGFYATLLDLHRKKMIAMTEKEGGEGIEIRVLSSTTDPYEQRVIAFIQQLSENGVLDTGKIGELARSAQVQYAAEEKAVRFQHMLTDITTRADAALPVQYIVDGSEHIIPLLFTCVAAFGITVIIALVASMQAAILYPAVVLWGLSLSRRVSRFSSSRPRCLATGKTITSRKNSNGTLLPTSFPIWP